MLWSVEGGREAERERERERERAGNTYNYNCEELLMLQGSRSKVNP